MLFVLILIQLLSQIIMENLKFNLPPVVCRMVASYLTMEEFSKMFKAARFMHTTLIASEAS
jgi:hypothetical protein